MEAKGDAALVTRRYGGRRKSSGAAPILACGASPPRTRPSRGVARKTRRFAYCRTQARGWHGSRCGRTSISAGTRHGVRCRLARRSASTHPWGRLTASASRVHLAVAGKIHLLPQRFRRQSRHPGAEQEQIGGTVGLLQKSVCPTRCGRDSVHSQIEPAEGGSDRNDGDDKPPAAGRNGERDCHEAQRRNATQASTTDPDAMPARMGPAKQAKLPAMVVP